jgi:hypothetical protein
VAYYGLDGFKGLRVEGKLRKVSGLEMVFDCRKIRQGFCDYPGSVSGVTELPLTTFLITFCNCIRLVAAVITIGGILPVFPELPLRVLQPPYWKNPCLWRLP